MGLHSQNNALWGFMAGELGELEFEEILVLQVAFRGGTTICKVAVPSGMKCVIL